MVAKDWSKDLEHDDYENNIDFIIEDAVKAVEQTSIGHYVNLVTSNTFGNPDSYLTPVLDARFGKKIRTKFIDQCGCGGYVLRVWKLA
ncbi:CGCGG family putative rSAM-modified RiPP protein [Calidifontibacillus oryziterrae]|uniref:CGCGG family putative rSAM-modified RiPP protein n=1 Tax=Calidifontibacillus oryziterrae TaxID=1191699 RepID=UPI0003057E09|nr:CGCGG family rSAM-modified RiPP protein [Calidifontibacillus oryziterrae]